MKTKDFQTQLRETGCYRSPKGCGRHPLPPFLATPLFSMFMAEIFVRGNIHSRRPGFMEKEWSEFGLRVVSLIERIGGSVEIEGFGEIKNLNTPVVWACNHVSALETYLLPPILMSWPGLIIVLKESLAHYPCFGAVVRAVSPIRVQRNNPIEDLRKVLNDGTAGIRAGRSALIFPQGTRYRQFDPASFNTLGAKLALHAKVPMVPIAVSTDFLRIGRKHRDLGATVHPASPVRISCGPVIPCDLKQSEIQNRCLDFITSKLAQWETADGLQLLESKPAEIKSGTMLEA